MEKPDSHKGSGNSSMSKEKIDMPTNELGRQTWGRKIEFLMTCIGYAVGLGNIWRFPYLCYENGGGAFLIPYISMVIFIGLPIYYMEFALGQFASLGPISVWGISPLFKGVGYGALAMAAILAIYYPVIISYCLFYLINSFYPVLPWSTCNNWWNTRECGKNATTIGNSSVPVSYPEQEFYNQHMLRLPKDVENYGLPSWELLLCLMAVWVITAAVLIKGVKTLGKVSYFFAIFPYIMLTVMLVRGLTLEGSLEGIKFYLRIDMSKLIQPETWLKAATQIFFSLAICTGGLIAMSSYNKFDNKCRNDAIFIVIVNALTSFYAGFAIFANLGYLAYITEAKLEDVVDQGFGLAFIVYPKALSRMPIPQLWSVCFFMMMLALGFGSQFSIFEAVLSGFQDELVRAKLITTNIRAMLFRLIMCGIFFLLGFPLIFSGGYYLLLLLDKAYASYPLLIIAGAELIIIIYVYGIKHFLRDIIIMEGSKPSVYWRITWLITAPILCIILAIVAIKDSAKEPQGKNYVFPSYSTHLFNLVAIIGPLCIVIGFIYQYCKAGGWILYREMLKPVNEWGPSEAEHRERFISDVHKRVDNLGQKVIMESSHSFELISQPGEMGSQFSNGFFRNQLYAAEKIAAPTLKQYSQQSIDNNTHHDTDKNSKFGKSAIAGLVLSIRDGIMGKVDNDNE